MVAPRSTSEKTSIGIIPREGLLSAPTAPPAPTAGQAPDHWVDSMRAIFVDFDESDQEQPAAAHAPARSQGTASAIWRAMPVLVRVMFTLDLLMGLLYVVSRRVRNSIGKPLLNFFDLNTETNLPSWY